MTGAEKINKMVAMIERHGLVHIRMANGRLTPLSAWRAKAGEQIQFSCAHRGIIESFDAERADREIVKVFGDD